MIKLRRESHFRALIERSRDAVLLVDASANITYANPSAGKLLGYDPLLVGTMTILDLIHPNDRPLIEKSLLQSEEDAYAEVRLKHQNGSWLWFESTTTNLLHDPDVEGVFLNFKNITDRKEAQYNLQTQRNLLLNLVAVSQAISESTDLDKMLYNLVKIGKWLTLASSGSVFLFDQFGALVYTSSYFGRLEPDRVERLMNEGLTGWIVKHNQSALVMDTTTDDRWLELPSDLYNPHSALAIPIKGDRPVQAILVLTHTRPGHFTKDHLRTLAAASSQISVALGNARLYHEAQCQLADQNALLACSQDGFVSINLDGQVRVLNSAAMKLVGISGEPSEWVNRPVLDLFRKARRVCPELIKVMISEYNRVLKGDTVAGSGEIHMPSHCIHWTHTPIVMNNRTLGRLVVLRDITEQHKLEQQREELTDMIVHDLRNPASAVAGIITMLKSLKNLDEIPEEYDQMMQLAERNVNKILDLVQEILDVSQLENDQLPVQKAPVQIENLIEETFQLQRPIIAMKEINLRAKYPIGLPKVWADDRLIRRVLQNLVDNAAKFSRRNGSITVAAQISAENPDWLQVSVQDHGVGIPPELKSLVFEKFVTNRHIHERGAGIGLTFCRLAILAHGGRIWAESEENLGSTFYFTLPISP